MKHGQPRSEGAVDWDDGMQSWFVGTTDVIWLETIEQLFSLWSPG